MTDIAMIVYEHNRGVANRKIAKRHNLSEARISQILKEHKLK